MLSLTVVLASTCAGLAPVAGALPVIALRPLGRRAYDMVLGFGAGLMLAAATVGLLGHAISASKGSAEKWVLAASFVGGVLLMFLMERVVPHLHAKGHGSHVHGPDAHADHDHVAEDTPAPISDEAASRKGMLIAGAMALHRVPEGFAIGAGYVMGQGELGLFLTVALSLQNLCEGIVLSVPLLRGGLSKARTLVIVAATGMATPVAAILGLLFFQRLSAALPAGLAVAAGALLYLVLTEILPESHSHGNETAATLALLGGFGTSLGLHALIGHHH